MSWKVYNIHTGRTIKAGFEDEESAKDWLEMRRDLSMEDYLVEELDEEEEEALGEHDEDDDLTYEDAEHGDDDYLDPDEGILGGDLDGEELEDEDGEEQDEEDDDHQAGDGQFVLHEHAEDAASHPPVRDDLPTRRHRDRIIGQLLGQDGVVDGRRLESVSAVGKNLVLRFEGGVAVRSHLRMSGRWSVRPTGSKPGVMPARRGSPVGRSISSGRAPTTCRQRSMRLPRRESQR